MWVDGWKGGDGWVDILVDRCRDAYIVGGW